MRFKVTFIEYVDMGDLSAKDMAFLNGLGTPVVDPNRLRAQAAADMAWQKITRPLRDVETMVERVDVVGVAPHVVMLTAERKAGLAK